MPDPATDTLRTALEALTEAVTDKIGTMNYYFGPGARTAVSGESEDGYRRIVAARDAAREALAAAPDPQDWEWRAVLPRGDGSYNDVTLSRPPQDGTRMLVEGVNQGWVERRRKRGEWERI